MTRARLAPAVLTLATLAAAWALWSELPRLIAALGLQRYDLLVRVLLAILALSLADRAAARLSAFFSAGASGQAKDSHDEH